MKTKSITGAVRAADVTVGAIYLPFGKAGNFNPCGEMRGGGPGRARLFQVAV